MKADTSFKDYAKYYDLIYKDKDYEKEVDFIENIFWKNKPKKILEVGCGNRELYKNTFEKRIRSNSVRYI